MLKQSQIISNMSFINIDMGHATLTKYLNGLPKCSRDTMYFCRILAKNAYLIMRKQ